VGLAVLTLIVIWFGPEIAKSLAPQPKRESPASAPSSTRPRPRTNWPPRSVNDNSVRFIREALTSGGVNVASVDRMGAHGIIELAEGRDVGKAKWLICGDRALMERMSGAGLTTFAIGAPGHDLENGMHAGYRTDASIESEGCGNNWRKRWEEDRP
jgi:hypothetical protein